MPDSFFYKEDSEGYKRSNSFGRPDFCLTPGIELCLYAKTGAIGRRICVDD